MDSLLKEVKRAKRIFVVGNGGSYANSEHLVNDLILCSKPAFTINAATFSALSNDYGYQHAFAIWIDVVGRKGDLLIAMSGSGKSPNILNAIKVARKRKLRVYKIFGKPLGQDMQTAEQHQIIMGHEVYKALRK